MGLKENLVSYAKERLDLTEQVFVTVGVDRKRMRPAPGTILVEILGNSGETLAIDTIKAAKPAPKGPWHVNELPTTYVSVGETGYGHQAFSCDFNHAPFELPDYLKQKASIGASRINVWWSCEE
jgi:hypothetical protein